MIDSLIAELDKEMTEAETEDKLAQEEYEQLMADSAEKRASTVTELMATEEYFDWLMQSVIGSSNTLIHAEHNSTVTELSTGRTGSCRA